MPPSLTLLPHSTKKPVTKNRTARTPSFKCPCPGFVYVCYLCIPPWIAHQQPSKNNAECPPVFKFLSTQYMRANLKSGLSFGRNCTWLVITTTIWGKTEALLVQEVLYLSALGGPGIPPI